MESRNTDRASKDALFPSPGIGLSGCFAWLFWSLVHVFFLIGFRGKANVLLTQGRSIEMDRIRKSPPDIIGQHLDLSI